MSRYSDIRKDFSLFREALEKNLKSINENETTDASNEWNSGYRKGEESIPYNMQDELMASSIETCKKQFGADFDNFKTPMLYYPQDGDVVLSGEIGGLNNAKFQFRLKDPTGEGCFIWTEPIQLTESNINQLKIVYGVFKNWKTDLETAEDKKPMGMQGQKMEANNQNKEETQGQSQSQLVPGDDY